MILGALIDAGCPADAITRPLAKLGLPAWRLKVGTVMRGHFRGMRVEVVPTGASGKKHGILAGAVRRAIKGGLPRDVAESGDRIIRAIIAAEGRVHGAHSKGVHLHELDDLDTVVDVFGAVLALRSLGVDRVFSSPVAVGAGFVSASHGIMPVPAPGTAELLRGCTVRFGSGTGELATPTGAAILAELAEPGIPPPLTVDRIGYGAGSHAGFAGARGGGDVPNLLRVFVGSVATGRKSGEVCQVEAVVDDMNPQLVEAFFDRVYREGALEAWTIPATVKKARPGIALTALTLPDNLDGVIAAFLEETTTLGVRITRPERVTLARRMTSVLTKYGPVRIKTAGNGAARHVTVEFRDARRLADRARVPVRIILEEAGRMKRSKS
jgi:uncharacterized protein (TIGR00299 family) protein